MESVRLSGTSVTHYFRLLLLPLLIGIATLPGCTLNHLSRRELVDQMDVPDENVRLEAVWLLGSRGPDAIDPLLTRLYRTLFSYWRETRKIGERKRI